MPSFAGEGGEKDLSSSNLHRLLLLILETGGQVTAFLSHVVIMSSWYPEEHPRMFFWNPRTSYRPCVLGDTKNSHFPLGALGNLRPPVGAWQILGQEGGALWATVHGVIKSWTWLKQLSMHAHTCSDYVCLVSFTRIHFLSLPLLSWPWHVGKFRPVYRMSLKLGLSWW